METTESQYASVIHVVDAYHLTDEQRNAVADAYGAYRDHLSPFICAIASDMLTDLRRDVADNPGRRVMFLGRDGHSLAAAVRGLDPDFADNHCVEVVLSRAVVDAALQDQERNLGKRFPQLEGFRVRDKVDVKQIDGAFRHLTRYLRDSGVPVGRANSSVTVVDTSFKGTVQEMLAAAYPKTSFFGRYAFFGASPEDPHPGTKRGYAFHREADDRWQGIPLPRLPEEAALTFGASDGISVIENTLNGPRDSPTAITTRGPVQQPIRNETHPLAGLNPVKVPFQYRNPLVREAVKTAGLLATYHVAEEARRGLFPLPSLPGARDSLGGHIRAWVGHQPGVDPRLRRLLDGFVRLREDSRINKMLSQSLNQAHVPPRLADHLWGQLAQLQTIEERQAFAQQALDALRVTQAELKRSPPSQQPQQRPSAQPGREVRPQRPDRGEAAGR